MNVSGRVLPKSSCFAVFVVVFMCVATNLERVQASKYCDTKLNSMDVDQARVLRGLGNLRLTAKSLHHGFPTDYTVGVCGNVSKADPLAGVLQNHTTVLGRVNNTSVVKGEGGDWMLLMFGSGDVYPETSNCSGPRVAFVMIHCTHNISAEKSMRFIKEAKDAKESCFFMLEVHSQLVCLHSERIGGGTIFIIILICGTLGYFCCGILYRRFILGAKGVEQIPHVEFWITICGRIRDGGRFVFQRPTSLHQNSWDNLNARAERDDDSLLSP